MQINFNKCWYFNISKNIKTDTRVYPDNIIQIIWLTTTYDFYHLGYIFCTIEIHHSTTYPNK